MPVQIAEIIVPSRVPTMEQLKKKSDSMIEKSTQLISKPILVLPKLLLILSESAFTNASPEFIITFAITASAIPKPRTITPITIISN